MFNKAERIQLREQAIVLRKMGWTQRAIADHIGVPPSTISEWLSYNMKGTFLTFPKFKVGDKVQVNGLCPKYILEQIRHNRVRTVVGVFYDSKSQHCFYTLGTNKWAKSMDYGWVHFFRSEELKPVEGRGPGRPRKKRRYNLRMKCTVTPSNQRERAERFYLPSNPGPATSGTVRLVEGLVHLLGIQGLLPAGGEKAVYKVRSGEKIITKPLTK